jgi:hypothetical protein
VTEPTAAPAPTTETPELAKPDDDKPATPGNARVEIHQAARAVIVEAPEPLDLVRSTALEVWKATEGTRPERGYAATGFVGDLVDQPDYRSPGIDPFGDRHGGM